MRGWLCDPCGRFFEQSSTPAATYEHRCPVWDPNAQDNARTVVLEAHLCDDCAVDLTRHLNLLPDNAQTGEDSAHDTEPDPAT